MEIKTVPQLNALSDKDWQELLDNYAHWARDLNHALREEGEAALTFARHQEAYMRAVGAGHADAPEALRMSADCHAAAMRWRVATMRAETARHTFDGMQLLLEEWQPAVDLRFADRLEGLQ